MWARRRASGWRARVWSDCGFNGGCVDHSIGAPRRWFVTVGETGKYLAEETRKDAEKLVSIDTLSCSPGEVFLADGLVPLPLVGEQVSLDEVFFLIL